MLLLELQSKKLNEWEEVDLIAKWTLANEVLAKKEQVFILC